jgi:hypothetical protein
MRGAWVSSGATAIVALVVACGAEDRGPARAPLEPRVATSATPIDRGPPCVTLRFDGAEADCDPSDTRQCIHHLAPHVENCGKTTIVVDAYADAWIDPAQTDHAADDQPRWISFAEDPESNLPLRIEPGAAGTLDVLSSELGQHQIRVRAHGPCDAHLPDATASASIVLRDAALDACKACDGDLGFDRACRCRMKDRDKECRDADDCEGKCVFRRFEVTQPATATSPALGFDVGKCSEWKESNATLIARGASANGPYEQSPGHHISVPMLRDEEGGTTVNGRLPRPVIERIIRQHFRQFRVCYEAGLRNNPKLEGRVGVAFAIDRQGAVSFASDGGSDIPDQSVVQCVVSGFRTLSFPAPEGGTVAVNYPIVFKPYDLAPPCPK